MEFSLLKFDSDSRFIREVELKILLADLDNLFCTVLNI
jgi:hypothetical protein